MFLKKQTRFIYRRAKLADVEIIHHIEKHAFGRANFNRGDMALDILKKSWLWLVACPEYQIDWNKYIRDNPIGYVGMRVINDKPAHIYKLGVLPKYQKKGIGTKLLKQAIDYAQNRHCPSIYLECRANNLNAQKIYKKIGFKKTLTKKNMYKWPLPPEDGYIMTMKNLQKQKLV